MAHLLREHRETRGKTLRQAASEIGIAPSQLSRLESGQRRASGEVRHAITDYYGIPDDLMLLAEGRVPNDIAETLLEHPEVLEEIRERYQNRGNVV